MYRFIYDNWRIKNIMLVTLYYVELEFNIYSMNWFTYNDYDLSDISQESE